MSAFICGPDHFIALAVFATEGRELKVNPLYVKGMPGGLEKRPRDELATLYANILYSANIRSVMARYPSHRLETLPGPTEKSDEIAVTDKHFNHVNWSLEPTHILKMCNCLEYQSCEVDDWEASTAYQLLDAIRGAAIRALPGYEDAPWEYCVDDDKPSVREAA